MFSTAWIEGTPGNDTFTFSSEANLTASAVINGNGGGDTISMSAPVTLNSGDFANITTVQTLQLTGASTITLGANAAAAGIVNVVTGNGATSITDSNGGTFNVNATALAQNTALTLAGSAAEVVTGLVGDIAAGSLTGALTVTTGDAADNGISITTGSAATSITDNFNTDTVTVNATASTANTLTVAGSANFTVTLGSGGSLAAGAVTGNVMVTGGSGSNTITTGSGNDTITGGGRADLLTGGAGVNQFVYTAISDSTVASHDTITDFVHGTDTINSSAIAGVTAVQGLITGSTQVGAGSIAWIQSGSDTLVYANNSIAAESQVSADVEIVLVGVIANTLTASDFIHH